MDKEGNLILGESELNQLYEEGERLLKVISITDDKGVAIESGYTFSSLLHTVISEQFSVESPKTDRQYTIKYKAPWVLGESSVEELKLIFNVDGINSGFTNAWYNSEEVSSYITIYSFCPEYGNPQYDFEGNIEEIERKKKEVLYNGKTVAYTIRNIHLPSATRSKAMTSHSNHSSHG